MNDALYIAATGMQAQQAQLDTIANNVANVNTAGFKRGRVSFSDLIASMPAEGAQPVAATGPGGLGAGVTVAAARRQFAVGDIKQTGDPMSIAIQGDGFIEALQADGGVVYTRGGKLKLTADRVLATADGLALRQRVQVADDIRQVLIGHDGQVSGRDDKGREWSLGRIDLVMFADAAGLAPIGDNAYRATAAAGEPLVTTPGESGSGRLMQGFEEGSNVNLIDEMVQMMVAQRAYEMSVKVVQAADEVAGMVNNMRKG